MKKTKIVSLLLAAVMILAVLTACGASNVKSASSFKDFYNSKYIPEDELYNKATELSELDGFDITASNDELVLFESTGDGIASTYKIYSYEAGGVVKTLTSSATTTYSIELCGNLPAFFVTRTKLTTDIDSVITYVLCSGKGKEIASSEDNVGTPVALDDTLIYNSEIFTLDEEGNFVKGEETIPETLSAVDFDIYTDKYLYDFNTTTVSVYDRAFKPVSHWIAPSAAQSMTTFLLDNGNILAQYSIILDPDTTEYDYYETDENGKVTKYDLVTLVINAKNGEAQNVDVQFVIEYALSYDSILSISEKAAEILNKKMGNLAFIHPIVNGQIDNSDAAADIVLLSNDGKSAKSLKIADGQTASLPQKLNKDMYLVETTYGLAVVKANGKLVHAITNDNATANGKYIIGEKAIYDINTLEVVYTLKDENTNAVAIDDAAMNSVVFIIKGDLTTEYTVEMLNENGEIKELCSYNVIANTGETFHVVDGIGCYAIYDVAAAEYTYYTLDGTMLTKSAQLIEVLAVSYKYDTILLGNAEAKLGYCTFANVAEAE